MGQQAGACFAPHIGIRSPGRDILTADEWRQYYIHSIHSIPGSAVRPSTASGLKIQ